MAKKKLSKEEQTARFLKKVAKALDNPDTYEEGTDDEYIQGLLYQVLDLFGVTNRIPKEALASIEMYDLSSLFMANEMGNEREPVFDKAMHACFPGVRLTRFTAGFDPACEGGCGTKESIEELRILVASSPEKITAAFVSDSIDDFLTILLVPASVDIPKLVEFLKLNKTLWSALDCLATLPPEELVPRWVVPNTPEAAQPRAKFQAWKEAKEGKPAVPHHRHLAILDSRRGRVTIARDVIPVGAAPQSQEAKDAIDSNLLAYRQLHNCGTSDLQWSLCDGEVDTMHQ